MPRAKLKGGSGGQLDTRDLSTRRLINQQIAGTGFTSVQALVGWMGAVQAQDYAMAKWALGTRLPGSTDGSVEQAIDKGEIIRTHVLRPTWHFVSAQDVYWMLELTGPRIRARLTPREKYLGLAPAMIARSNAVIERALRDGQHLTRDELVAELKRNKLPTTEYRDGHLIGRAELEGIICSGATKDKKPTYALLSERVPNKQVPGPEEALARLAHKYFSSHGPATIHDFAWWSGLPVSEARRALELTDSEFNCATYDGVTYWFPDSSAGLPNKSQSVHVLPAFDEYIVSYQDRRAVLMRVGDKNAVTAGGVFRPIIVVDGQVTGIWKRQIEKERVTVKLDFFDAPGKATIRLIEKAFAPFARFVGKPEVEFIT